MARRSIGKLEKSIGSLLLIAICLTLASDPVSAGIRDFKELTAITKQLESAQSLLDKQNKEYQAKRQELLALFAREPKSLQCDRHYEQLVKVVNDYRIKAYNYASDCKKGNNNWFSNVVRLGGPLGAMKGLSKFDANLMDITQRYESQSKKAEFGDSDIDCDLLKFQIRELDSIVYVLQTDIKYLAIEDPQVLNTNILHQLRQEKFVSQNNFYDIDHLTARQAELLEEFYASRVDLTRTPLAEAISHFHNPGNLIIGRLLDSCHSLANYEQLWRDAELKRQDVCSKSTSDPLNGSFGNKFKLDKYADATKFCREFLDAL